MLPSPPAQGGMAVSIRFIVGFLFGFLLGASVALAFAPQPGTLTRQQLWERVKDRARRDEVAVEA